MGKLPHNEAFALLELFECNGPTLGQPIDGSEPPLREIITGYYAQHFNNEQARILASRYIQGAIKGISDK